MLALYLASDAPSYRFCMMVVRECSAVISMSQIIVVDGGREFQSTYFEMLLARYEVTKKTRPPARPRFGSVYDGSSEPPTRSSCITSKAIRNWL